MRLPENCLKSFTSLPLGGCARICRLMGREQYREQRVQTLRGTRDLLFHLRRADQGRRARSHSSVPPPILRTSGGSGWPWGLGRACGPGGGGRAPWSFFWEKRGTMVGVGARGFQRGPRGQRCSGSGSPCLAIIWAPEKYWRPWLTELFFRFEPAPPL